jgi:hypothetical protein
MKNGYRNGVMPWIFDEFEDVRSDVESKYTPEMYVVQLRQLHSG